MINNKKILVTGATSFIGKQILMTLIEKGFSVDGISFHGGTIDSVKIDSLDISNFTQIKSRIVKKKYDIIFHFASARPSSKNVPENEYEKLLNTNVTGTLNILKAAKEVSARVVYASSLSVCSGGQWNKPVTEKDKNPGEFYSATKLLGEDLCESFRKNLNMPVVSLRFSSVYGFGENQGFVMSTFINNSRQGKSLTINGKGLRTFDFVYIKDVVDGSILAGFSKATGVYNIGSGVPTTVVSLAKTLHKIFNKCRIIYKNIDNEDMLYLVADISRAKKDFEYSPQYTNLSRGIIEYKKKLDTI